MRLQRQRKAPGREGGDAPQAKGTKKRQSQGNSYLRRGKGEELCTSLVVGQQIQGRGGERGQAYKGRREAGWGRLGKARFEASCQFQTNHFVYIPSSSS